MGIADKLFNLRNEKADANLKTGLEFLALNKEKPGVVELPSGLQYEIMTEGEGIKPMASQNVTCHYHGTLIDGTVFDSYVKRGQPATFPLNGVIKCWTEGVQRMKVGGRAKLTCPPSLAYGEKGAGATIPPNATLQFEVELLAIKPQ